MAPCVALQDAAREIARINVEHSVLVSITLECSGMEERHEIGGVDKFPHVAARNRLLGDCCPNFIPKLVLSTPRRLGEPFLNTA